MEYDMEHMWNKIYVGFCIDDMKYISGDVNVELNTD